MTDLFGNLEPERVEAGDLFEGAPRGLSLLLAEKRETLRLRKRDAQLRPDDEGARRRLAVAEREYLQFRDFGRRMSAAEVSAALVASGEAALLPDDNRELF